MNSDNRIVSKRGFGADFLFSQSNLQDYVECRRRFQLRYILKYLWPAVQSEPTQENELYQLHGIKFHQLAHQLLIGILPDLLSTQAQEEPVRTWWQNFLEMIEKDIQNDALIFPETSLSTSINNHRIVATYDLILNRRSGGFTIYDWKTSRRHPGRKLIAERIQTRLYPYILVKAGNELNDWDPIAPESIEMVYWFAEFKDKPIRFRYSNMQFLKDQQLLESIMTEIIASSPEEFFLTNEVWRCKFCNYRSLCDRGESAGKIEDSEAADENIELADSNAESIDFEGVSEIEF